MSDAAVCWRQLPWRPQLPACLWPTRYANFTLAILQVIMVVYEALQYYHDYDGLLHRPSCDLNQRSMTSVIQIGS